MANPYLQVLRTPHALPMVLAAFIGRLPLSMVGLGCVLLVAAETGSYGLRRRGRRGRRGDHRAGRAGARPAGRHPRSAPGAAAGAGGLRARRRRRSCSRSGRTGRCGSSSSPPGWPGPASRRSSSMIRVRWTHLLRGSHRLPTALAMESVVDEFVFIVGPVLVTFLSTTGHATSGVVTAFALAVVGSLLFAAQGRTEPPPRGARAAGSGPSAMRARRAAGAVRRRAPRWARSSAPWRSRWSPSPTRSGAKSLSGVLIAGAGRWGRWPAASAGAPCTGGCRCGTGCSSVLVLLDACSACRCCWCGDVWLMVPFVVLAGVAVSPVADQLVHPRRGAGAAGGGHRGLHLDRHGAGPRGRARGLGGGQGRRRAGANSGVPGGDRRRGGGRGSSSRCSSGCSSCRPSAPARPGPLTRPPRRKVHQIGGVG